MIADDIRYIPLDNSLIVGPPITIEINEKGFFLSTKEGILHFDPKGNFIRTIAKKGRGPNEYIYGHFFTVNAKNDRIYIADQGKIKTYTLEGNFIRDISTQNYISGMASDIDLFHSTLFVADYGTNGKYEYNWIVLDTLGNLISQKPSSERPSMLMFQGNIYQFDNKIYYSDCLNDTIFSLSSDLKYKAAYLFAEGDFRMTSNIVIKSISQLTNLFSYLNMFETKHYFVIAYTYKAKRSVLFINRKTKEMFQGYREEKTGPLKSKASIFNDIDGGLSSEPEQFNYYYYVENNEEFIVTRIEPYKLKLHVASEAFKNSTPKYPENKKELEQLANSLDENDNPVLMLVKLKD